MDAGSARDELLERVQDLLVDDSHAEELRGFSEEQLREVAEALGQLAAWTPERRSEHRKPVMCRVEVAVPMEGEKPGVHLGLQEDSSVSGARVLLQRALSVGTRVKIRRNGAEMTGTVQQCTREKFGYAIGIHYDAL
jgi:hypothetical protein